ncbi:MAG: 1-phosphofructokinase family hexose kinase [Solirubrobacteraceae bacterium]|nr:1-phosphofructokinase family hexose kinase [Solirubrobacteraceae bacterium]
MIITVTLNAAIDKTLIVPNFQPGRRHRTVEQGTLPGGKGVNVARTLKRLGVPVIATGFQGGPTGTRIVEALTDEQVLSDFVRIREESRTNTALLDPTNGVQTEINERGPQVTEAEVEHFRSKLLYLASGAAIVIFAGSLPRGVDPGLYGELIRDLRSTGVTVAVDAEGEVLNLASRGGPTLVTPNRREAEELVGYEFSGDADEELIEALAAVRRLGPAEALITLPDGCAAALKHGTGIKVHRARIPQREAVAPIGSGDAFLAGFLAARYQGRSDGDALRYAVACGADSTQRLGAGVVDPDEVARLSDMVELAELESDPATA